MNEQGQCASETMGPGHARVRCALYDDAYGRHGGMHRDDAPVPHRWTDDGARADIEARAQETREGGRNLSEDERQVWALWHPGEEIDVYGAVGPATDAWGRSKRLGARRGQP